MKTVNLEEIYLKHYRKYMRSTELSSKNIYIEAMREACYKAIDLHQRNVNKELADICSTDQIIDEIAEQTKKQII